MEKECFKCHIVKPLGAFYKHKMMADGHLGKCKECTKKDAATNRLEKVEYYRAYDVYRFQTKNRREACFEKSRKGRTIEPRKYAARTLLGNAVRDGKITRQNCSKCNAPKAHAHHESYDRPLEVVWLCPVCHSARHKEMKKEGIVP